MTEFHIELNHITRRLQPTQKTVRGLWVMRRMGIQNQTREAKMKSKMLFYIAIVTLISACATGERIVRLDPGMSKNQVIEVM